MLCNDASMYGPTISDSMRQQIFHINYVITVCLVPCFGSPFSPQYNIGSCVS